MGTPTTKYVSVDNADVAYQIVGNGPFDLLWCYGLGGHVDLYWETGAEYLNRLASFSRLIVFDRRGTGASDAVAPDTIPTWEEWSEDMAAVLEASGSTRTAIMATLENGPIAVLFAAMHPERVSALVLVNTFARYLEADDYPIGVPPTNVDALVEMLGSLWGTEDLARLTVPSRSDDAEFIRLVAKILRASATPRAAAAQYGYLFRSMDVRSVLPLIQAPTLVLHVSDSPLMPIAHGRYLAEHIAGATFHEIPGADLGPLDEESVAIVAEFLTGEPQTIEVERILTTVLFTDIVGSTERAASLGDRRWRALLDSHDRAVRDQFRRFRGSEIKTTGDGFMVSFDGPARAIRCAQATTEATRALGIDIRVGIHTGECEVRGDDLAGLAVHIAARIGALAGTGEVLVSSTVKDLVIGSGIEFQDRGDHKLKGVPGSWKLLAVEG